MKITLIIPSFLVLSNDKHWFFTSKAMGIRSLSSFLKSKGHEIQLIDGLMEGFFQSRKYLNGYQIGLESREIAKRVAPDADIIGISAPFCYFSPICHEIVAEVRKRFPNKTIIMGGIYPTTQPRLALTAEVDYIVVGEGEIPLEKIAAGENPANIKGVYSKKDINNSAFPSADCITDLDSLPAPDNYLLVGKDSPDLSNIGQNRSSYPMIRTSRGCPFDCRFCSIHLMNGYKFRACSSEKTLDLVQQVLVKGRENHIEFDDDNFTLLKDRTVAILEGIIKLNEQGYNINWRAANGLRIDTIDEEVVKLFKRSNCTEANLALEHGDPDMLRLMNKKIDLEKAYNVFDLLVKYDIPEISTFIIVGYPGETRARFNTSIQYVERVFGLRNDIIVWPFIIQPLPGTKLEVQCIEDGLIDENTNNYLIKKYISHPEETVTLLTPDFDENEVMRRRDEIYSRFNPEYMKLLKPSLKNKIRTWLPRKAFYDWRNIRQKIMP